MAKVLLGFVPWIAFTLVSTRLGPGAVGTAAILAFLVAGALLVRSVVRGETPKLLEVTAAAVFLGFAATAVVAPGADGFLDVYGRSLAAVVLALVIFLLLPVMPFTEQYARESVPREYWHTREFRAVNRRISAAWGGVIAAMSVSHLVAGLVEVPDAGVGPLHRPVDLVLNWLVPGLLIWTAVTYTRRETDHADHEVEQVRGDRRAPGSPGDGRVVSS